MADPKQHVLLFGAPRSGTTWLQNMLGSHPAVVTPNETDLFSDYIAPLDSAWRRRLPSNVAAWARYKGLPALLTQDEFQGLVVGLATAVYGRALALKPRATTILDKVPGYARYGEVIHRYLPDARFIHLIRDGRDVAASMRRAQATFGRDWAPREADRAAWFWRGDVTAARRIPRLTDHYVETRYEGLRSDNGAHELARLFAFCGVETTDAEAQSIYEQHQLSPDRVPPPSSIVYGGEATRLLGDRPSEPEGFIGAGRLGGWADTFSARDRFAFDLVAGDLLIELGYEPDHSWVGGRLNRILSAPPVWGAQTLRRLRFAGGASRLTWRTRRWGLPPAVPKV